ncbi:MAG: GNAT family N-acetyltransferase [Rhodocyclaceae bacterium]
MTERHASGLLATLAPEAWDRLGDGRAVLSHAYLHALEASGSVGPGTGWDARHLISGPSDGPHAAAPLYLKRHSYGEYVFDWAWADAYARHGLDYYPKWLGAVPFTPIPGPRLLGRDEAARRSLIPQLLALAEDSGLSSLHLLFVAAEEAAWLRDAGFLIRNGVQFHWHNRDYTDFADFLGALNNDKRKKIRQERQRAARHDLEYDWLDGSTASAEHWRFFYQCYALTYALHRSTPYLTPGFFTRLAADRPDAVRLLIARRGDQPIAAAFFLHDRHALYGRYWGATEYLPHLHFELCYYRAIAYCIDHHIARFEGGAQGEHKLSRGLEPVVTYSAHWIRDPRFRDAVDRFLERETQGMAFYLDELSERRPFRKAADQ